MGEQFKVGKKWDKEGLNHAMRSWDQM